jgi:flagellar biosynthesis protein FlhA
MANTDIAAPAVSGGFSLGSLSGLLKRSDLGLAIGIMAILIVLILPLPTWLLDVSLAF